jgi:hypothetical protein
VVWQLIWLCSTGSRCLSKITLIINLKNDQKRYPGGTRGDQAINLANQKRKPNLSAGEIKSITSIQKDLEPSLELACDYLHYQVIELAEILSIIASIRVYISAFLFSYFRRTHVN